MRRTHLFMGICIVILWASAALAAPQGNPRSGGQEVSMNRLITFNGTLKGGNGQSRVGAMGITFSLYTSQEGGDALWRESQTVQTDEQGRYTVLLGLSEKEGLPLEVFSDGKAQWLGVQVQGEEEQARVLLVAVPYALKAADADTIGGKPLSSFVTYEDLAKAQERGTSRAMVIMPGVVSGAAGGAVSRTASSSSAAAEMSARMLAKGGIDGPVYSYEGTSNTFFGDVAGKMSTGQQCSFFGAGVGYFNAGDFNSFFGFGSGAASSTGAGNSFFGYLTGFNNTVGGGNSFFGQWAGNANTAGNDNSFFGSSAGAHNTTGDDNAFFGRDAGAANSSGDWNSFFGRDAGYSNTTGTGNAFFGWGAGRANTTYGNSFFGSAAGYSNTSGTGNAFFGNSAGSSNTTGGDNAIFGTYAGQNNTTGDANSFFGKSAGTANTTGAANSFFGRSAGTTNTTGYSNSFFGLDTGAHNTTGFYNSFFGRAAGTYSTTGDSNAFFGVDAGFSNTAGNDNAFFGRAAGRSSATASSNSFFGRDAGYANSTGGENSFFGMQAGLANTTGYNNSFFGKSAGEANTTGAGNAFFGHSAGYSNTTAARNSFFGAFAGYSNNTGDGNAFFGRGAGYTNNGNNNSSFGFEAGYFNTTGGYDSFFGYKAGQSNTTENNNSFIGAYSDGAPGVINATAIGYRSYVAQSNSLVLGGVNEVNGAAPETNVGIGVTNPDRQLTVEGTQAIGRFRRYYGTADPFTGTFGPAFLFERARGTQASPSDMLPGDYLGKVQFRGRVGGSYPEYGALAFIASDTAQNGRFAFLDRDIATERVSILNTGNVGIGTTAPTERLHVVGNIRVTGSITYGAPDTDLPDYVFDPNYKLMRIDDLEKFIAKENHLPNVPAAAEIKANGLNLGNFQMRLLEKIEELTLYVVQQNKALEQKESEIAALKATLKDENASRDANIAILRTQLAAVQQTLRSRHLEPKAATKNSSRHARNLMD